MPTVRGGRVFGAFKPIAGSGGLPVDLVGHQVERKDESVANGLVPWEKHWSRSSSVPTRCVDDEEEEAQVQRRSGWRGPLALAMPGWIARGWRGRALRVDGGVGRWRACRRECHGGRRHKRTYVYMRRTASFER